MENNTNTNNQEKLEQINDRVQTATVDQLDKLTKNPVKRGLKIFFAIVGVLILLSLLGWGLSFVGSWFNKAAEVAGPANVSEQYQVVINDYKGMEQAAINACAAKNTPPDPNSAMLIEDPAFAYAATYRRIAVDYNTRQNNIFQAKLVGPKGYPRNAPSLEAMQDKLC